MAELNGKTMLYLLRHGEPHEKYRSMWYGQMDVELSERGLRQSAEVTERLGGVPMDVVYSSDLERAGTMADHLAEANDLPVRRLEVFRERDLGVFQGMTLDQMEETNAEEFRKFRAGRALHRVEGAENFEDVSARVVPAVEKLIYSFPGKRIALVCHAGPIRVTLAHVLGMPLENIFQFTLGYASVNVIEFDGEGGATVKLVNG